MSWHKYKILAAMDKIKAIKSGVIPKPSMASISFNYCCNQRCLSCAFDEYNKSNFIMSKDKAFSIINELISYGVDVFEFSGGGEPTLTPYLKDILLHIIACGKNFSLLTNGVNFNDELMEVVAKYATYCRISLETGDKDLYCKYKQVPESQFDQVVNNIKKLVSLKDKNTEISVKFDVDKNLSGIDHLNKSYNLAISLGVDIATFKSMTGLTEFTKEDRELASSHLDRIKEKSKTELINSINYDRQQVPQCWLTPLHTVIDAYGDVYLCCYYYRKDAHTKENHCIGNLNDKSFSQIWESIEHKNKIDKIDKNNCVKFDCKFFGHHQIINDSFKRGQVDLI
jgi:sulfatase maturation enzyme AslB (radical SAM superfamily)